MVNKTLFDRNLIDIKKKISEKKIYKYSELTGLLKALKNNNQVSQAMTTQNFLIQLQKQFSLKTHTITSEKINHERYSLSNITAYEFVDSLATNTFFSMTTALNLRGLSKFRDDFIFYSQEQKEKNQVLNKLTQSLIDNAFKKEYRYTHSTASYGAQHVVFLKPKFSSRVEVKKYQGFYMSSVNRSLVEIILNIQYFKDFETIIENFKLLKNKLNINKIYNVVEAFNLIYPYFQLLGFALNKIGYNNKELDIFKQKVSKFKFYTQKNKLKYSYDKYWQIYY